MNGNSAGDFERARRIVKTDDFSSVFRLRPVFRTEHFVLYARPNQLSHARLGVVAAKRLAPRAVTRNTVKRAVREVFRQSDVLGALGLDCVVRLSKSLNTKAEPARTAVIKHMLHKEVLALFAIPSKLHKVVSASLNTPHAERASATAGVVSTLSAVSVRSVPADNIVGEGASGNGEAE